MTGLEINKALAMAIGWTESRFDENGGLDPDVIIEGAAFGKEEGVFVWTEGRMWRRFDYLDPTVIWPIAKQYGFPLQGLDGLWSVSVFGPSANTPEKAIALVVIHGAMLAAPQGDTP